MKRYRLTAVIWKEGSRYVSNCPEVGVASYGRTAKVARKALKEAVELYRNNAKELGLQPDLDPSLRSGRYTALIRHFSKRAFREDPALDVLVEQRRKISRRSYPLAEVKRRYRVQ